MEVSCFVSASCRLEDLLEESPRRRVPLVVALAGAVAFLASRRFRGEKEDLLFAKALCLAPLNDSKVSEA